MTMALGCRWTGGILGIVVLGTALLNTSEVAADSISDWARMRAIVPRGYVCRSTVRAPKIDGQLDDPAWQAAAWTDRFVDIEGRAKPKPRFLTRVKMLWDHKHFYIAADMQEPHVWGTLTRHDSVIFHDNDFEVFIDPDGDTHEYYEFEMNALNTGWDLFLPRPYKDGGRADNSWDIPGLKTAVHVRGTLNDPSDVDRGWSVEIAIPWKVLAVSANRKSPPASGDQWRVNFSRVEWRHLIKDGSYAKVPRKREDNWVWSPQGIIDMHRPEKWGTVQFSDGKTATRFRPDPAAPARTALMTVYHHQKSYVRKHRTWAASLKDLGLGSEKWAGLSGPPVIELTSKGYVATAEIRTPGGGTQRWRGRWDSRLSRVR